MKKPSSSYRCPCGVTLSLIGGKYKIVILWHLYQEATLRFNALHRLIPEATTSNCGSWKPTGWWSAGFIPSFPPRWNIR